MNLIQPFQENIKIGVKCVISRQEDIWDQPGITAGLLFRDRLYRPIMFLFIVLSALV